MNSPKGPGEEQIIGQEPTPPSAARWTAAVLCILYAFAKLNGAQFTILDSELARPMGQVSGFWLTWYYFGYSKVYATLLALIQLVGGILLIVPRTALVAALVLLPVVVNIVLIDLFYGVDLDATLAAILLTLCLWTVVAPYLPRLRSAVLLTTLPSRPQAGAIVTLGVVVAGAFAFTWWLANYNNRVPTPIDGVWSVTSELGPNAPTPRWRWVFFEYNRAHMAVFRAEGSPDEQHHFEVAPDGTVRLWERWLTKGQLIMQGRLTSPTEIQLDVKNGSHNGQLILRRVTSTP